MQWILRSVSVFLLLISALAGCRHTEAARTIDAPHTPPASSVTVNQLAKVLDLDIVETDATHVMLENSANRVFIFTDPDGRAYVNGKEVSSRGGVVRVKGVLFVPRAIELAIRSELRKQAPPPPVRTVTPHPPSRYTVVIDAGHGGKDPGATSCLGFFEKTVNLTVALALEKLLIRRGLNVVLTRNRDVFLELDTRAARANNSSADLFVSIHADSCPNPQVRGFTVYICRGSSSASRTAAQLIEKAMARSGLKDKGIREANFRVLVKTRCPAVLVELGYLSNAREAALLSRKEVLEGLALALARGISDYFEAGAFTL